MPPAGQQAMRKIFIKVHRRSTQQPGERLHFTRNNLVLISFNSFTRKEVHNPFSNFWQNTYDDSRINYCGISLSLFQFQSMLYFYILKTRIFQLEAREMLWMVGEAWLLFTWSHFMHDSLLQSRSNEYSFRPTRHRLVQKKIQTYTQLLLKTIFESG